MKFNFGDTFSTVLKLLNRRTMILLVDVFGSLQTVMAEVKAQNPLNPKEFQETDEMVDKAFEALPKEYKTDMFPKATDDELKGLLRACIGVYKFAYALIH